VCLCVCLCVWALVWVGGLVSGWVGGFVYVCVCACVCVCVCQQRWAIDLSIYLSINNMHIEMCVWVWFVCLFVSVCLSLSACV
jgi:hypothetical protein